MLRVGFDPIGYTVSQDAIPPWGGGRESWERWGLRAHRPLLERLGCLSLFSDAPEVGDLLLEHRLQRSLPVRFACLLVRDRRVLRVPVHTGME